MLSINLLQGKDRSLTAQLIHPTSTFSPQYVRLFRILEDLRVYLSGHIRSYTVDTSSITTHEEKTEPSAKTSSLSWMSPSFVPGQTIFPASAAADTPGHVTLTDLAQLLAALPGSQRPGHSVPKLLMLFRDERNISTDFVSRMQQVSTPHLTFPC